MMAKYMQVVWLYLIGLIVILIGVYTLITNPGPVSFVVMLVGLAVAAIGAAHGRKMRMMGQFDMDQMMKDGGLVEEGEENPEAQDVPEQEEGGPPEEAGEEPRQVPQMGGGFKKFLGSFRKTHEEPLSEEQVLQLEIEDIKDGKIVPTEADIIEFICPVCSAANEERNYFCFKCGNKLRRKTPEEDQEGRTHLKVDPGAISIRDDQRVAKVVMCPECNTANKIRNKYCWSCGKKIKSDTLVEKKEKSEKAIEASPKKKPKVGKPAKKEKQFKK